MRYTKDTKKNKPHPNEGCAAKEICYAGHYACCLHCALSCCHGRHDREGHERLIDSFFHLSIRIAISRSPNRRLYCALPVVFYVSDSTHTPAFPARQESPADRFAIPRPGRPLNFLVQRAVFHARRNVRRSQLHCASAGAAKAPYSLAPSSFPNCDRCAGSQFGDTRALPVLGLLFPFLHRARRFFSFSKKRKKRMGAQKHYIVCPQKSVEC